MKKWMVLASVLVSVMVMFAGIGAITADSESPIQGIEITVSPNTLNLASEGTWVTVHTDIPYGAVATLSLELLLPFVQRLETR